MLKITIDFNGERIIVEKEGEATIEDIIGALKSGLRAAKYKLKELEQKN